MDCNWGEKKYGLLNDFGWLFWASWNSKLSLVFCIFVMQRLSPQQVAPSLLCVLRPQQPHTCRNLNKVFGRRWLLIGRQSRCLNQLTAASSELRPKLNSVQTAVFLTESKTIRHPSHLKLYSSEVRSAGPVSVSRWRCRQHPIIRWRWIREKVSRLQIINKRFSSSWLQTTGQGNVGVRGHDGI